MKKSTLTLPEIMLVGIKVRTNNQDEQDWTKGKIFPCVQQYFHQQLANKILHRKKPGTTFCAYTEYESDFTGNYTYFIGEEVTSHAQVPEGFEIHTIPTQNYAKFTTEPGALPNVLSEAWQKIWEMSPEDFGANRRYHTDFEVYDERAADHERIVLDIYIGLTK